MTSSSKQVYTYIAFQETIFQKVQKSNGYEVESSLKYLEEYDIKGERRTRIMSLETDTSTKDTNQSVLEMIYQAEIPDFINREKEFKQKLHKTYTVT